MWGGGGGGGGGVVYFTVMFDHPSFPYFCRSGIPTSCYIFNVFYYLYIIIIQFVKKILSCTDMSTMVGYVHV